MNDGNKFDFETIIDVFKRVITEPRAFYSAMPTGGGYANPSIFVLVMGVLSGIVMMVLGFIGMGPKAGMATGFIALFIMPIAAIIGSFIGGLLLFVIWKLMGSAENFETAYRSVAFSMAIMPVVAVANLLPYLGQIIQIVWGFWLLIIASELVHKIDAKKAMIVFGIIGAIMLWMNLSAEYAARKFSSAAEEIRENVERYSEKAEDMSGEEMSQAATDFFTGLSEASTGQELSEEQKAAVKQTTDAFSQFGSALQEMAEQQENGEAPNAEQLGAIFGKLAAGIDQGKRNAAPRVDQILANPALNNPQSIPLLATLEKQVDSDQLYFAVNDTGQFATPSGPIERRGNDDFRIYLVPMGMSWVSAFTSLAPTDHAAVTMESSTMADAAAVGSQSNENETPYGLSKEKQQIRVRNAFFAVYDNAGTERHNEECADTSVLEIPAHSQTLEQTNEIIVTVICTPV